MDNKQGICLSTYKIFDASCFVCIPLSIKCDIIFWDTQSKRWDCRINSWVGQIMLECLIHFFLRECYILRQMLPDFSSILFRDKCSGIAWIKPVFLQKMYACKRDLYPNSVKASSFDRKHFFFRPQFFV